MTPDHIENAKKAIGYASSLPNPTGARCGNCTKVIKDPDAPSGFCCMQCSENKAEDMSQEKLRALVLERDFGICAECGMDAEELRREMGSLKNHWNRRAYLARVHQLVRLGFPRGPVERGESLWSCDHIREVASSGPSTLQNAQTLCLACHSKKTNGFAKKRADSRKPKRGFGR